MFDKEDEIDAVDLDQVEDDEPELEDEPEGLELYEGQDEPALDDGESEAVEEDDDTLTISIGDDEPEEDDTSKAPDWVRDLRKQHREEKKKVRELQEKLDELSGGGKPAQAAPKPTLESVDFDTDKYETELANWYESKRDRDLAEAAQKAEQETAEKEWTGRLESYKAAKSTLKVRDYDDAEEAVQDSLSVTQQGMILQGADSPAELVYALGRNPKRLKELSAMKDPVKFAFAVAKLETQLKRSPSKSAPKPERTLSGTGRASGSVDNTLERLRAEAAKSGDFSKVTQYKRSKQKT